MTKASWSVVIFHSYFTEFALFHPRISLIGAGYSHSIFRTAKLCFAILRLAAVVAAARPSSLCSSDSHFPASLLIILIPALKCIIISTFAACSSAVGASAIKTISSGNSVVKYIMRFTKNISLQPSANGDIQNRRAALNKLSRRVGYGHRM